MKVSWKLDTLGDFVIMRSNGQPVYNFCVTVDDATMSISHVKRVEEHLPNILSQALIYKALGFPMPSLAHVSLILHLIGANCQNVMVQLQLVRDMGYLPQAMVNYLALLGWGDGTENEFFTIDQLGSYSYQGSGAPTMFQAMRHLVGSLANSYAGDSVKVPLTVQFACLFLL
ncbi:hypothetical protein F3Y22_tig00000340pilonHSYRG01223 [Hibiscus syriacus]|uniref:Glutamyl/glutaminyl-tRNA synthetase class Ib catalytic domain-containing protein n=1 Tax=Hibiscus syriacus TaxID=106335 RepID=A0A6A3D908_HIBSY|nr:hypothetical protein F3Y22_tig00000340pilonHSYRG01223 [Hibiscus syriacus]